MALRIRRKRRKHKTKFRLFKPRWVDPYPWIPGTEPEKRIFAALKQLGIYFVYQDILPEWKVGQFSTLSLPRFIPDFQLPQWKVIIDPFGDYHHLLPDAIERDIRKQAVYESMGYRFYHPWASDIDEGGAPLFLLGVREIWSQPLYPLLPQDLAALSVGYRLGSFVGLGSTSVGAANRRRPRKSGLTIRARR